MSADHPTDVTRLLREIESQTPGAVDQLMDLIYQDLYRLAKIRASSPGPSDSLQATGLVNEVFLKLFSRENPSIRDRAAFFSIASRAMRDILIDRVRKKKRIKRGGRGGKKQRIKLSEIEIASHDPELFLDLTEAVDELSLQHPRQARVVELKFYGGLETLQIADMLEISKPTVDRDWAFARAWLQRRINGNEFHDDA